MNVGQALACFLGEIWCRSSFDHVITLTIIQGNYLITSMKVLTAFGQHFSNMEIVAPIPYLDFQRSNDPSIISNCRNCGSLSLEKSKVIDSIVFNLTC